MATAEAIPKEVVTAKPEATAEPPLASAAMEKPSSVSEDKSVIPVPYEKVDDSKALAISESNYFSHCLHFETKTLEFMFFC